MMTGKSANNPKVNGDVNGSEKGKAMKNTMRVATAAAAIAMVMTMTGCGLNAGGNSVSAPTTLVGAKTQGRVIGGQQPVSGAAVYLYAASTSGYAGANTNILTSAVATDAGGNFALTGKYTCTTGQQMYLVAVGGNPGLASNNPQLALMAALGDCANLNGSTYINMNEVTTVASVFALAPFMSSYTALGSSATNTAGLARAFNSVNKLANIGTGSAGGPSLAAGATAPLKTINTIANILAACVNSTGGVAGDNTTACGHLFSYATPSGGSAPTDTIGLALAIAQNPTLNVSSIYPYSTPTAPFQPVLSTTPTDFTLAISYPLPGSPQSTTVDGNGQIWVANKTANTVTVLNQSGTSVATLQNNGLNAPTGVAIDASGNAWIADTGGSTVSAFTNAGSVFGSSPFTVGTNPVALAFDPIGNLWVSNSGSNNITELNATGSLMQTVSSGVTAPGAIAINPK